MTDKPSLFKRTWTKLKKWLLGAVGIAGATIIGIAYIGETPQGDWQFQRTLVKKTEMEGKTPLGNDSIWMKADTVYDTVTIQRALLTKILLPDEFKYLDSLRKAAPDSFNVQIAAVFNDYMEHKTVLRQTKGIFTAKTFLGIDTLVVDTPTADVAISWQGNEWLIEPRWERIAGNVYDYTGIYDLRYESNWICKGTVDSLGNVVDQNPVYSMQDGIYKARLARRTKLDPTYGSTDILRSVGKSGIVEDDHSGAISLTVSGDTAYFSSSLADSVGVGDCVMYYDTVGFVHQRLDGATYVLKTHEGTNPVGASEITTWWIYRAYASIADAEAGIENPNVPYEYLGGNLNLTALNKRWHIACYKDQTDTFSVVIDGWTCDSANYLRIFTPVEPDEVGTSQRHNGTAGTGYKIAPSMAADGIRILDDYVRIKGIEITDWTTNAGGSFDGINIEADKALIEYVIVHDDGHGTEVNSDANGINLEDVNNVSCTVRNSIVYRIARSGITIHQNISNSVLNIENCTVYRCLEKDNSPTSYGCIVLRGTANDTINARNVIGIDTLAANKDFAHFGYLGCDWGNSSNNISSDSSAPGPNSLFEKTASSLFQSIAKSAEDLHLKRGADAVNAGTTLSDSFSDDVDGESRTGTWDIGADELVPMLPIFYSVGTQATALYSGNASASNGILALASPACDSIGVGDEIRQGSNRYYIRQRNSSTEFLVQNSAANGGTPGDTAITFSTTAISIFRAFSSLSSAESGAKDANHLGTFDLLHGNYQLNLACYGDGADNTAVTIDGWDTGQDTYIRIFTPVDSSEVGISQRHDGKWNTEAYRLESSITSGNMLWIQDDYIRVDGLQFHLSIASGNSSIIRTASLEDTTAQICISNCIVRGTISGTALNNEGIILTSTATYRIWNNVVYGFNSGENDATGIDVVSAVSATIYCFNNTIYDCDNGYRTQSTIGSFVAKNNVALGCNTDNGFVGTFDGSSTNNASNHSGDAPGTNPILLSSAIVTDYFVSASDFHINPSATYASEIIDAGANLSSDSIGFSNDIDVEERIGLWDVGADEYAGCTTFVEMLFGDTSIVDTFTYGRDTTASEPDTGIIDTVTRRRVSGDTVFTDSIHKVPARICSLHVDSNQIRRARDSIELTIDTCEGANDTLSRDTLGSDTIVLPGDTLFVQAELCTPFDYDSTVFAIDTMIVKERETGTYLLFPYVRRRYFGGEYGK